MSLGYTNTPTFMAHIPPKQPASVIVDAEDHVFIEFTGVDDDRIVIADNNLLSFGDGSNDSAFSIAAVIVTGKH